MPLRNSNKNNKRRTLRNFNKRRKNLKLKYKKGGNSRIGTTAVYAAAEKPLSSHTSFAQIKNAYREIVRTELKKPSSSNMEKVMPNFPVLSKNVYYDKLAINAMENIYDEERGRVHHRWGRGSGTTASLSLEELRNKRLEKFGVPPQTGGSKRRRRSKRTKQRKLSKKRKYTNKNKSKKTKRRRN